MPDLELQPLNPPGPPESEGLGTQPVSNLTGGTGTYVVDADLTGDRLRPGTHPDSLRYFVGAAACQPAKKGRDLALEHVFLLGVVFLSGLGRGVFEVSHPQRLEKN